MSRRRRRKRKKRQFPVLPTKPTCGRGEREGERERIPKSLLLRGEERKSLIQQTTGGTILFWPFRKGPKVWKALSDSEKRHQLLFFVHMCKS